MILIEISEIKKFMSELFVSERFDDFLLENAYFLTNSSMELSGKRNMSWYDKEQRETMENAVGKDAQHMTWKEVKAVAFAFIKGKRTPQKIRISFKLQKKQAKKYMECCNVLRLYEETQPDLFLQFRYEKGELSVVTGIAHAQFTMDRTIEQAWDTYVKKHIST